MRQIANSIKVKCNWTRLKKDIQNFSHCLKAIMSILCESRHCGRYLLCGVCRPSKCVSKSFLLFFQSTWGPGLCIQNAVEAKFLSSLTTAHIFGCVQRSPREPQKTFLLQAHRLSISFTGERRSFGHWSWSTRINPALKQKGT